VRALGLPGERSADGRGYRRGAAICVTESGSTSFSGHVGDATI